MFQDLMNMEGVAVLSKKQQSSIQGGGGCSYKLTDSFGRVKTGRIQFGVEIEGANNSIAANSWCVDTLTGDNSSIGDNSWTQCQYDCDYDNPGGEPRDY